MYNYTYMCQRTWIYFCVATCGLTAPVALTWGPHLGPSPGALTWGPQSRCRRLLTPASRHVCDVYHNQSQAQFSTFGPNMVHAALQSWNFNVRDKLRNQLTEIFWIRGRRFCLNTTLKVRNRSRFSVVLKVWLLVRLSSTHSDLLSFSVLLIRETLLLPRSSRISGKSLPLIVSWCQKCMGLLSDDGFIKPFLPVLSSAVLENSFSLVW